MSKDHSAPRRGVTLTEMLVVVGVLLLLVAIVLPVLNRAATTGRMAAAGNNMRWIGVAMGLYSGDFRDYILPSQFNHRGHALPARARDRPALDEWQHRGTWADLLWSRHQLGVFREAEPQLGHDYQHDSPDEKLYDLVGSLKNPLRSPQPNTYNAVNGDIAEPFGYGALEVGEDGYFAANNFFNDDEDSYTYNPHGPFTNGQIRDPQRSMYLVDSFGGEVINFYRFCDIVEHQ